MAVGTKNRVAFGTTEGTFGTATAITNAKSWPFTGDRPRIVDTKISDQDSLIGVYEVGREKVISALRTEAIFEFDFRVDCWAYWLYRALGTKVVSGVGPYVHTFTQNEADSDSFTIFWVDANTTASKVEQFPGCKVKSLTLKGSAGGPLKIVVEIIGAGGHAEATNTMVALNTSVINPFSNISAANFGGSITFTTDAMSVASGTNILALTQEFELKIENMYEEGNEYVAGQTTMAALDRTGTKTSGRILEKWQENALVSGGFLDVVEKSTNKTLWLVLTNATHGAKIALARCYYDDPSAPGGRNKLRKPLNFDALYDDTAALAGKFEVTNATASYS